MQQDESRRKEAGTERISFRLPEKLREDLEHEAEWRGITFSALVRIVLTESIRPGSVKLQENDRRHRPTHIRVFPARCLNIDWNSMVTL